MSDLTLYIGNKNYSSWSLRAWLALKHAGARFEEVVLPLYQPESPELLRRHSPSRRVPALRHDAFVVWESLAICEYAAELLPEAGLWPADRETRAVARAVANEMHGGFGSLRTHLPMDIRGRRPPGTRLDAARADIERVQQLWRDCRGSHGSRGAHGAGPYLFGGFTIADAMFAPVATRCITYGVPLDSVGAAYVEAIMADAAMREWVAAANAEPWTIEDDDHK
ncbi:MAG TPA: glutathione S-transferase family protein [Dongiaceae bacterium]|jgi:glutathione S-transferase